MVRVFFFFCLLVAEMRRASGFGELELWLSALGVPRGALAGVSPPLYHTFFFTLLFEMFFGGFKAMGVVSVVGLRLGRR